MKIHKITPSLDYNKWLKVLTLNLMNQPIVIEVPKVVEPTDKKILL